VPHVRTWERAREIPRDVYAKAGKAGLLGVGMPEKYGGVGGGIVALIDFCDELARAGSGGVLAALGSHQIALPPLLHAASDEIKRQVLPPVIAGEKVAALAISEPGGGSDVASLSTSAVRDGDDFIVRGEKTFITSGMRADFITLAVRTGGAGPHGVSLLLIDTARTPGITRTKLDKMGWHCSDTAHLHFDDCRVPLANLIGAEGSGFSTIMKNFNNERLMLSAQAEALARVCYEEALAWARQRRTFGKPLIERQVIRHKLVDMAMRLNSTRAFLNATGHAVMEGEQPIPEICQLKNLASANMEFVVSEAVAILGGMGYMEGTISERVFRETKVIQIGGGATEIMKDLAARQAKY